MTSSSSSLCMLGFDNEMDLSWAEEGCVSRVVKRLEERWRLSVNIADTEIMWEMIINTLN